MMNRSKILGAALLCALLGGCIASMKLSESELEQKISNSPYMAKILSSSEYNVRTRVEDIELYFKSWHLLNVPDNIENWQQHYVIGTPSDPPWDYVSISDIEHYQREIEDDKTVLILAKLASKSGGDALINLYREPVVDGNRMPCQVLGYKYKATIVRKT